MTVPVEVIPTRHGPPRLKLAAPEVGDEELAAIAAVLYSGVLTNGPETVAFERAFAERHGTEHAVAFANGTVALAGIYLALGIGPGDEVVVPSMTFISTATSVLHVGATPVFADVDARTFNLDPASVARAVSRRTKAIVAVHYGGQPADMDALAAVADDAGVILVEDAAEAHGASYRGRPVGGLGRAAMFSFTPTKNLTCGEGGMVTTDDGDLAAHLRLLRNHGQHGINEYTELGYNWRMTEMQAAMGRVQLGKLDAILDRKRANADWNAARLSQIPGVVPPLVMPDRTHTFMLYTALLPETARDLVLSGLVAAGIEARLYFPPAHRHPLFCRSPAELPVTEEVATRMISLPFHSRLERQDLEEIASTLDGLMATAP